MTGSEKSTYGDSQYDKAFYLKLADQAKLAAPAVFKILRPYMKPSSVVDIGCGDGSWLKSAKALFGCEVLGIDGAWNNTIVSSGHSYLHHDLEKKLALNRRFDLAICLEVVEHLTPVAGNELVHSLTEIADVVLFSAAIVGQEGTNHINCQWQSYWAHEFSKLDYFVFDLFRPALWPQQEIPVWYKQNMLLLVKRNTDAIDVELFNQPELAPPVDLVHPQYYEEILYWRDKEYNELKNRIDAPTTRFVARTVVRYISMKFRNRSKSRS